MSENRHEGASGPFYRRRIFVIAASVLVLTVVILTGAAVFNVDRTKPQVKPGTITSTTPGGIKGSDVIADASRLAGSGETSEAIELLRRRVSSVPSDAEAKELLRKLEEPAAPKENPKQVKKDNKPSDPSTPSIVPDNPWDKGGIDLLLQLPVSVRDLDAGSPTSNDTDATKPFEPLYSGRYSSIRKVVYSIHDRGSGTKSRAFLRDVSQVLYPKSGATVTVAAATGYYGTNATTGATIALVRGRYVLEVSAVSYGGAPPSRDDLELLAEAFPTKPRTK